MLLVVGVVAYLKLNSNITQLDVWKLLGKRPVSSADRVTNLKPLNILVIGSDTQALGTNEFGTTAEAAGGRPDTTLIVHLSGDRKTAVVVSVPRDSMTRAPCDCKTRPAPSRTAHPAVERQLLPRRPRLPDPHGRGHHGHLHRPFRGTELPGLSVDGRRSGFGRGLRPHGYQ